MSSLKTRFTIETESNAESIIEIILKKPLRFREFVKFCQRAINCEVIERKDEIVLSFTEPELGFSIYQSFIDLLFETYLFTDREPEGALYDQNMNEIPRPKGEGKVHKLQRPSRIEIVRPEKEERKGLWERIKMFFKGIKRTIGF